MTETEKRVPELRFEGFIDDWEQRELKEILKVNSGRDYKHLGSGSIPVYGTGGYMLSVNDKLSDKDAIGIGRKGTIDKPQYLKAPFWTVDTLFFMIPLNNFDLQFLYTMTQKINWKKMDESTGVPSLSKAVIEKVNQNIPSYQEQIKIGGFFKQLDNTIALHQRKVTLLKRLKEAYLTRMLPQNSENIPLLRFADYFDPWEQRKFEDLAESFNYGLNASAMEFDGENKYIRITDIDEYSHRFIQSGLTSPNTDLSNANDYLLKEGDILFARTGASVGKSYQYDPLDGKVYYAGFLIRARIKPEFDSSFIFQNTLTEKYNNFIKITSQRSGQPGVNAQEYANFSIMVPSRGEQVKLGNFFKQLDNAIALHQCKIEKLAKAKKVLLAAMFV